MKKKKAGIIASSVAAIAVCSSMVVGSTLALFTSEDKVNIAVTSGKVEFTAEVGEIKASSTLPGQDGAYQAVGSASKENGVISIDGMSPGDMFEFTVTTTNTSTISAWYRAKIEIDNEVLAAALTVKIGEATAAGLTAYATEWENLAAKKAPAAIDVAIAFPDSVEDQNVFQGKTGNIIVTVEGIQGNTAKPEADELTFNVANGTQFEAAVKAAQSASVNTTINLVNDITLSKAVRVEALKGKLTINGNNKTITAAEEKFGDAYGRYDLLKFFNIEKKVTVKDVTLEHVTLDIAKDANDKYPSYHTLDINGCKDVELENVTLIRDVQSENNGGAPLVINAYKDKENKVSETNVTAKGLHLVAGGANTWYGANVDASDGAAKLTIDENFTFVDLEGYVVSGNIVMSRAAVCLENGGEVAGAMERLSEPVTIDGKTGYFVNVAKVGNTQYYSLNTALEAVSKSGGTIEVLQDVALTNSLYFESTVNGDITLNGNGHTVTAARNFTWYGTYGRYDLIKLDAVKTNIVIKDIKLEHISLSQNAYSYHTLDINTCAKPVVLENVTLVRDTNGTKSGAPLVVKNSEVKATGLNIAVGGNSWYGINVDGTGELTVNGEFAFATTATKYVARCEGEGTIVGLSDKIELDAEKGDYGFYVLK